MPSGSHRGGRSGSHSSGGSRSGSSFSGGFSSRSSFGGSHYRGGSYHGGHHHHHRPFRIHFGRRYYVYGSGTSSVFGLLGALFIFALMFTFCFSAVRNGHSYNIDLIQEDYSYYQHVISYAKTHKDEGYIVNATVTDRFYNEDADKYYITYVVKNEQGRTILDGYTYSCFTRSEAFSYQIGGTIEIAVNSVPITSETDSINTSYYGMAIEKDGEYLAAKNAFRNTTIVYVICVLVDIAIAGIFFVLLFKKAIPENGTSTSTDSKTSTSTEGTEKYCSYCGSLMSKSSTKCPSCGAGGKR